MTVRVHWIVCIGLLMGSCGRENGTASTVLAAPSVAPSALEGTGWIDDRGVDCTAPPTTPGTVGLRVVVFFDPQSVASRQVLRTLADLQATHPGIVIAGATASASKEVIAALRVETGARFPVLLGLSPATRTAWGIQQFPAIRGTDAAGSLVARTMIAIQARIEDDA